MEFACVAPLLFLMIFGMVEFGRMIMVQQIIINGSREGARAAIVDGATTAAVTSTVNSYLSSMSVAGAAVAVSPSPPSLAAYGAPVTVTVTVPFSQVSWLSKPMYLSGTTLTARTVMRRETVQ